MISSLDTNILLDILIPNAPHADASKALLDTALIKGSLIISETVYAELSAQFSTKHDLDEFVRETGIRLIPSSSEALYAASDAWRVYLSKRTRKTGLCSHCGATINWVCAQCGEPIPVRQHILSDFLIGGHALVHADRLLTRDRGYYRTYFAELRAVSTAS